MEKVKNILTQNIVINLTYAIITVIYFVFISTQYSKFSGVNLNNYIHISSLFFIGISIVIMEISFKKSDELIFTNGIEFLAMAVFILLTQHMTKLFNYSIQVYTLAGANFIGIYYILKSAVLYTKNQQDKLNSLSDIKEIVKDEPIKKASKRKNKREEGK